MPLTGLSLVAALLGALSVSVAPGTPCLDEAALARRLESEGVGGELSVSVRADGQSLLVEGQRGQQRQLTRRIPARAADCASVERVVVALVRAWARTALPTLRAGAADAGVRPTAADVDAGVVRSVGPPPLIPEARTPPATGSSQATAAIAAPGAADGGMRASIVDVAAGVGRIVGPPTLIPEARTPPVTGSSQASAAVAAPSARTSPRRSTPGTEASPSVRAIGESADAGALAASPLDVSAPPLPFEPEPIAAMDAGASSPDGGAPDGPTLEGAPRWQLGVGAYGGVATRQVSPQATAHGSLLVSALRGRWGVALEGGLESAQVSQLTPGTVWASTQWLSLGPLLALSPGEGWRVDGLLAFRVTRIAAGASGVAVTSSTSLLGLGGVLSIGASRRLLGPAWLELRAFASLRAPAERLTIDNAVGGLELGVLQVGALAGLRFDVPLGAP